MKNTKQAGHKTSRHDSLHQHNSVLEETQTKGGRNKGQLNKGANALGPHDDRQSEGHPGPSDDSVDLRFTVEPPSPTHHLHSPGKSPTPPHSSPTVQQTDSVTVQLAAKVRHTRTKDRTASSEMCLPSSPELHCPIWHPWSTLSYCNCNCNGKKITFQVLSCISHVSKAVIRHMWLVATELGQLQTIPLSQKVLQDSAALEFRTYFGVQWGGGCNNFHFSP